MNVRLPGTPAVYRRKVKLRLEEQKRPSAEQWDVSSVWRDNYANAKLHADDIEKQVEEHVARGLAIKLTAEEAAKKCARLSVNSLGAVEKGDQQGSLFGVRIVMDGTHGVQVNKRIRVRDQDLCPIAVDVKRVQRAQAQ